MQTLERRWGCGPEERARQRRRVRHALLATGSLSSRDVARTGRRGRRGVDPRRRSDRSLLDLRRHRGRRHHVSRALRRRGRPRRREPGDLLRGAGFARLLPLRPRDGAGPGDPMSAAHRHGSSFMVLSLWLVGSACVSGDVLDEVATPQAEEPVSGRGQQLPGDQTIRIFELQLHGVSDSGLLEIELHLFDAGSNAFLGCSGPLPRAAQRRLLGPALFPRRPLRSPRERLGVSGAARTVAHRAGRGGQDASPGGPRRRRGAMSGAALRRGG